MRNLVIFFIVAGALVLAIWSRVEAGRDVVANPTGHAVFALDTSISVTRDCGQILDRIVVPAIEAVPISKDSTFSLIVTGGGAISSFEPRLVVADKPIPRATQTGLMQIQRKGQQTRAQFMNDIKQACKTLPTEDASSLYRTLEIGLEHLRPRCPEPGLCVLVFDTDMRENVNRDVTAFLNGTRKAMSAPKLHVGTIHVVLCGYASAAGGMGPVQDGRPFLDRVRSLFDGEVDLRPYCDGAITLPKGA